ncbi:MAG TPA: hypothetical protein VHY09_05310 [Candidatus Methylacidiphilales bacterium]|jgi:hypothetical protein|nr:hypothetical protein [Candidatus Methylacidiphilales bacterium]
MRHTIAKMGMTNTQLVGESVARLFPASGVPVYLILDGDGVVRYRHVGWEDSLDAVLRGKIDELLRARPKN